MEAPPPTDQAEAPIPPETGSNDPIPPETGSNDANLNRTVKLRRKAANHTEPLYLRRGTRKRQSPGYFASPPQDEDIPAVARKKPRLEEYLPTTIDEAARKKVLPDLSVGKHSQKRSTSQGTAWEDRLSELADYRKLHGHCNVPKGYSENTKLATWVTKQRSQYKLHQDGERSQMALPRIQALESLGFEWGSRGAPCTWEDSLSELADYRKLHEHCNVPKGYSENTKLATWVTKQRSQYSLHLKGKAPLLFTPHIEALESLGFEWGSRGATCTWENGLSELADYRKVHGHCNVPRNYSENAKLGRWVGTQRHQYSLHLKGKTSAITLPRIEALESLAFEWDSRDAYYTWEDLDPSIALTGGRKGKWEEYEDKKLNDAVQTHGDKDWAAISELIPSRTKLQCRNRWQHVLGLSIDQASGRTGKWEEYEDKKLKDAVQTHDGKNWAALSELVPGRTKKQCRNRWRVLLERAALTKVLTVEEQAS
jgi:hypothetical protein